MWPVWVSERWTLPACSWVCVLVGVHVLGGARHLIDIGFAYACTREQSVLPSAASKPLGMRP
jgi:hypothetical protein